MKTTLIVCMFLIACRSKVTIQNTSISIVRDITDTPLVATPQSESILKLYALSKNEKAGAFFSYVEITDKSLSPAVRLVLTPSNAEKTVSDEAMARQKQIVRFYDDVRRVVATADTASKNKTFDYSECFRVFCSELTALVKQPSTNKAIILFSNLKEKSKIFSCYNAKYLKMLETHPEKVEQLFIKTGLLPEVLKGINIYIVFQPKSRVDDSRFRMMAQVYKNLLESRGGMVHIQADAKHFEL